MDEIHELIEKLAEDFKATQRDLMRDYPHSKACVMLHQDLGLGLTPLSDEDFDVALKAAEEKGIDPTTLENGSIDLTYEHTALHSFIDGLLISAQAKGMDSTQVIALVMLYARRAALKEAAVMFSGVEGTPEADDTFPTEWLGESH